MTEENNTFIVRPRNREKMNMDNLIKLEIFLNERYHRLNPEECDTIHFATQECKELWQMMGLVTQNKIFANEYRRDADLRKLKFVKENSKWFNEDN